MSLLALKIEYGTLGIATIALTAIEIRHIAKAICLGKARPNTRLPPVTKTENPVAYWAFVVSWMMIVIPASAATAALFIGAALNYIPIRM
jgi:hypothetical protein